MCEYCERGKMIKLHRQDTDTNISECYIHGDSDGYALFLQEKYKVTITDGLKVKLNQMCNIAYLDISFCPFCGMKLGD